MALGVVVEEAVADVARAYPYRYIELPETIKRIDTALIHIMA